MISLELILIVQHCGGVGGVDKNMELKIPFAAAWMELDSVMLSEISQAVRDKYHMISPLTGT